MNSKSLAQTSTRKPKLLIVAPYYPPHVGGVENYVYSVARALSQDHGWRVSILTTGKKIQLEKSTEDGCTIYRLPVSITVSNTPLGFNWIKAINEIVERERPDIINVHAPVPGLADITTYIVKDTPVVVTYHAGRNITKRGLVLDSLTNLYEGSLVHLMLRRATHIISSSDFVRGTLLSKYQNKTTTITPGVDLKRFSVKRVKAGIPLLFVGSLNKAERYKGLEFLIDAIALLRARGKDVELVVAGDGSFRSWYEEFAKTLGVTDLVKFMGRKQGDELVQLYQECTLYVHPSTFDSCPLTVLEAMACGKPVLGSRASGIPFMIEEGVDGMLADPASPSSLAEHIENLLDNPSRLQRIGRAAREKVERKHDWKLIAARTDTLFRKILTDMGCDPTHHKLLVLAPYLYPHRGGVEKYIDEISKRLHDNYGWKVIFITTQEGFKTGIQHKHASDTYKLSYRLKFSNTPISRLWRSQIKDIISRERPDVINGHTPVPFLADTGAQVSGNTPFILSYHNDIVKDSLIMNFVAKLYLYVMGTRTLERANSIVVSSRFYAENSKTLAPYNNKIKIISPGVDLKRFHPRTSTVHVQQKIGEQPYILFVGQLSKTHRHKGLRDLLAAMAIVRKRVPDLRLVVIGEGDAIEDYKKQARQLGLRSAVIFVGAISEEELPGYFAAATTLVLPSTNASEGFGMVIIEAAACGTPAIGSSVGGIPYVIVNNKTGLLVPPASPIHLAAALVKLVENPLTTRAYGKAARERANSLFSWDEKAAAYDELLRKYLQ